MNFVILKSEMQQVRSVS